MFYSWGEKIQETSPKTSRSLFYIGGFVYGAGIFLIGQVFNLDDEYQGAFLLWALGLLPLAIYLKDKLVVIFALLLLSVYGFNLVDNSEFYPDALLILLPLIYILNKTSFEDSKIVMFLLNGLSIFMLIGTLLRLHMSEIFVPIILIIIGITMVKYAKGKFKGVLVWQGILLYGAAGIVITTSQYWDYVKTELGINFNVLLIIIIVSILFALYALLQVKQGSLPDIVIVCGLIIRFYTDITYDFLPKSLFFIVGGGILIAFGYWFEKKRRGDS